MSTRFRAGRVLIVDDNEDMAKCLADMVEEFEVSCDTVCDSEEAIGLLGSEKYQLVIADSQMPKVFGFSLLKYIKKNYPELPVAIMSTWNTETTKGMVTQNRADFYLPKPFTTSDIGRILARVK